MAKIPKKFLEKLQGKNVDTDKLESLADQVTKADLADEQKMRKLVRQLAVIAGVTLDQSKEDKIVSYIQAHNLQNVDMGTLARLLKSKI